MTQSRTSVRAPRGLLTLARMHGIQTSFRDTERQQVYASPESILNVLRAMRVDVENESHIAEAIEQRRRWESLRVVEPVTVAWDNARPHVALRLPPGVDPVTYELESDTGLRQSATVRDLPHAPSRDGHAGEARVLELPVLPFGYHRLRAKAGRIESEGRVISAPTRTYSAPAERAWGTFLPLYALRTARQNAIADVTDLRSLLDWTEAAGGKAVGTLPILASFLSQPFDPSPYAPASRLFWNELYLDLDAMLERWPSERAAALRASPAFRNREQQLGAEPMVDYATVAALKREVIQLVADAAFENQRDNVEAVLSRRPDLEPYARFRAIGEREGVGWPEWPEPLRSATITPDAYDEPAWRYHVFGQVEMERQLGALSDHARSRGLHLYLDFPLGVHPDSYDVWRYRSLFAEGASAGAPPDTFFTRGQDWGFRPMLPDEMRASGYEQWTHWLQRAMELSDILRIDHVMGLHRLYWVPHGLPASEGAYVRYPAEELFAVLSLESHRHKTVIVGEDLGTVPSYVREAMHRHDVSRTYVLQLEATPERQGSLPPVRRASVASLNTHDLPPFAAFWDATDLEERLALGHLNEQQAAKEREFRARQREAVLGYLREHGLLAADATDEASIMRACLAFLARSPAWLMLVNLEDLWLEEEPQNMPGTSIERPNWRRKARRTLEEVAAEESIRVLLDEISRLRQ